MATGSVRTSSGRSRSEGNAIWTAFLPERRVGKPQGNQRHSRHTGRHGFDHVGPGNRRGLRRQLRRSSSHRSSIRSLIFSPIWRAADPSSSSPWHRSCGTAAERTRRRRVRYRVISAHGRAATPQAGRREGPGDRGRHAATRVPGRFKLVYLVANTIMNVTTQDEQIAVFC